MGRAPMVIKGESGTARMGGTPRPYHVDDLAREAHERVQRAREDSERILREANEEAARLAAQAREAGYREGYAEGERAGREAGEAAAREEAKARFDERHTQLVSACQQLMAELNRGRAAWHAAARQDLVDLALAIARRVAHQVGERERDAILGNLDEAIRLTAARSDVTIAVHPQDVDTARTFARQLVEARGQWEQIHVVEEPDVAPGGCQVRWGSGEVDATLDTQLDRIKAALKDGSHAE